MSKKEIVIKGEIHTSRADLEEEREILKEGVDHLILEGAEEENWEFKPSQLWYAGVIIIFEFLFARLIYVDKTILEDIAEIQGAEVEFTRGSDTSILENSRALIKVIAALIFFIFFLIAIGIGLLGSRVQGSLLLLGAALLPLLILRTHESKRADTGRDIQIADMIAEAAKDEDRIVVIVGQKHAENIPDYLPEHLPGPDYRHPAYSLVSWSMFKELFYPGIVVFSVLYVVYSGLLAYVQFIL